MLQTTIPPIITAAQAQSLIKPLTREDWRWVRVHPQFPKPLRAGQGAKTLYSSEAVVEFLRWLSANPSEMQNRSPK